MKTLKHYGFLLLTFYFLLITGMKCKKNTEAPTDTLPSETQTGANTFGCLVDGKVFTPKGNFSINGLSTVIQFEILDMVARKTSTNEGVTIAIRNMTNPGDYSPILNENYVVYGIKSEGYEAIDGKVTITKYDTTNRIISGRFYFTGKNEQTGKTVSITDGRFDVKYTDY